MGSLRANWHRAGCPCPGLWKTAPEVTPVLDLLAASRRCSGLAACIGCGTDGERL
jgi:hypothetical protein